MRLIGRGCKRSDALSRPILIGRGLDLLKKRRERIENMLDRYSLVSALCSCQSAVKAERKKDIYGLKTRIYTIAVTMAARSHLFPSRTQKLSSFAPKILCRTRHGKIGRRCIQNLDTAHCAVSALPLSSVGRAFGC